MAKSKRQAYISVPSQIINSLSSSSLQSLILVSPKKNKSNSSNRIVFFSSSWRRLWLLAALFFLTLLGMFNLAAFNLDDPHNNVFNTTPLPPHQTPPQQEENHLLTDDATTTTNRRRHSSSKSLLGLNVIPKNNQLQLQGHDDDASSAINNNNNNNISSGSNSWSSFWEQPDGMGYRPCIEFSQQYRRDSRAIVQGRRKYLLVVVSGGMNQQRNQIVDAVVIARILGASLVVPILQVNLIWADESEFSDIFDLEHFKKVLADDVHIVSSLPSSHIRTRPVVENRTPLHASPQWIRARYLKRFNREGVLLLRSLDSRLSTDLPSDLQKLRCKVAFQALRFAPSILQLGEKLAERMRSKGPYLALHLRMEKDVWVRTGCLPGLTKEYDDIVNNERKQRPELLTARSNMSYHDRKLAGLCPLNALEVTRLLKALGAPKDARIYWAGGQPLGGKEALLPLTTEFPHFYNKDDLALRGELEPFANKASIMAAIDYIVCEKSDVFMASHGGNMGHALQGHRAYAGHRKYITPNKRHMIQFFMNYSSLSEAEFNRIIKELHQESLGQPSKDGGGKDVTKYPVPECMCKCNNKAASPRSQ